MPPEIPAPPSSDRDFISLYVGGWVLEDGVMVAIVADADGKILVHKTYGPGSATLAELAAIKEALVYCHLRGYEEVELHTDSMESLEQLGDEPEEVPADPTFAALKQYIAANRFALRSSRIVLISASGNTARRYAERRYGPPLPD